MSGNLWYEPEPPAASEPEPETHPDQGKHWTEVEQIYLRELAGYEESFGPDHPSTLETLNKLGLLYRGFGKLDLAEAMYRQTLAVCEKTLDLDHPSTLETLINLALLYQEHGKLDFQAEAMYERALPGYKISLGADDLSTLQTLNHLGAIYQEQSRLNEAEGIYRQALAGYERSLGSDHLSTLQTLNKLGALYQDQGKLDIVEVHQRALKGYKDNASFNPYHPSYLQTLKELGSLYQKQGKIDWAEAIYGRALPGYENSVGPYNPSTLETLNNLGALYQEQGRVDFAKDIYQRALTGYEKVLGKDHHLTQQVRAKLNTLNGSSILSTTARMAGIVAPALHASRLLLDHLRQIKDAPEIIMTLIETVDSLTMALASVESIQESEWSSLVPAMIGLAKSPITHSTAACVRFREQFLLGASRFQDGSLRFSYQSEIGFFKEIQLQSLTRELRTWQAIITSAVSIATVYECPVYLHEYAHTYIVSY